MLRLLTIALLAVTLSAPLAACGKKGAPSHPDGSNYPRSYPTR